MRDITHLVVHCTATPKNTTIASIRRHWKEGLGWKSVGYHKIIEANGNIMTLATDDKVTNGVAGHNATSLHVSYIGGKDSDDRTIQQRQAIAGVLLSWLQKYPKARICGHRDFPGVILQSSDAAKAQWAGIHEVSASQLPTEQDHTVCYYPLLNPEE